MLLLIDAGNTRVKWALVSNPLPGKTELGRWTASGMVAHAELQQLAGAWHDREILRVLISNVAGSAMRNALEQVLLGALGMQPVPIEWFAATAANGGMRNNYCNPAQLGCDRFASAIGAHALYPDEALIVATCGTATTIDAISADGVFLGGMILPGLGLMANALAKNTAQLPQVAHDLVISEPFADNTDAAIVSGCIAAQAGAIERAAAAHRQKQGGGIRCLLAGGAATFIAPHLTVAHDMIENLVLVGLHHVAIHSAQPPGASC